LNHYTLPVWIHDGVGCHKDLAHCSPRGWLDAERTTREIARYAAFVAREFGGEVDLWATENEPFAVVLPGYLLPSANRVNPPGLTLRIAEAKAVMVTLIEAHAAMYDAVKAADLVDADGDGTAASIGLVYATTPTAPKDAASRVDQRGADNVFYLYNTAFLDGVARGLIDADLDGKPDVATPRDDLAHRLDWLGLNYYTKLTVTGTGSASFPTLSALSTFDPTALDLSADDPRGLYEIALWAQGRYGLPMYITETGVDVAGDDTAGASWLVRHLEWAKRAVRDGADLRGFFYWSLIDNYEWNHGMGMKFGLYGVGTDAAKTRTPREAVQAYRDITRARDVPGSWLAKYPAPEP
jgi:beta-glucosidase/6-phospho-beta-glucosidase/beta-galactosidase